MRRPTGSRLWDAVDVASGALLLTRPTYRSDASEPGTCAGVDEPDRAPSGRVPLVARD